MEHVVTVEVTGRPATFATAAERPWKEAVRAAVASADLRVPAADARFSVRVVFRLAPPTRRGQGWDLDNLLKPTIDALEGVLGERLLGGKAYAQPDDERVDHIEAWKRPATADEEPGATIEIRVLGAGDGPE